MCLVMRKVNSDAASSHVYLWSPAPDSVNRAYHRIWGWVKMNTPTATSWGWGGADGIVEMTKGKLTYHFGRSLHRNDEADARAQLLGPPWRDLELQTQTAARSVAASGSARLVVQTADVRH